ncbi:shikimate dehydrogenase [Glycomyces harbinensis]|uniref:Shikimate dehydrogenase n=1 Tax=Glycomyces harbinensis TaxID=58114 RepID=A0A1G6WHR2_9ACTN|nr:shikimate dehydrogenase [Glycomyces harbinensis]SDD65334.1 shikimate dehydrogenase [Glycomyces harbinensis]
MTRAAVLGKPIEHSLSPVIHNAGYTAAGLREWTYTRHECDEPALARFVDSLDETWAGLSLTMPLKEVALAVADEATPVAEAIGAANTLVLRGGRRLADNTDAPGIVDALAEIGMKEAGEVAVLGAGGSARAALAAATQLGASSVTVYARRRVAVAELEPVASRLGLRLRTAGWDEAGACGRADLVISTVPKGVTDDLRPIWGAETVLFDILYDPWPTPLAAAAEREGVRVLDGLALLLAQAVRQWTQFTGVDRAPVAAMREALYAAVPSRSASEEQ